MASHQVFVKYLPDQLLSSNTWSDNRQKALAIHAEKEQITVHTIHAIREKWGTDLPHWTAVSFGITYCHTNKHPGDGSWRPVDPSNVLGDVAKAVIDAFTPQEYRKNGEIKKLGLGLIDDDAHPDFRAKGAVIYAGGTLEKVDDLSMEGILVTIQELVG